MTIVGILTGLAIPSYAYVTTSNRIASEINGLLGDLQYARAEAVKEGFTVSACSSSDGATCTGGDNWSVGWIVFADSNGNGTADAGEAVLRVQNGLLGGDTMTSPLSAVTFSRDGFALGLAGTATFTLHAATPSTQTTRCLAVTLVGMLTTETSGTGGCT